MLEQIFGNKALIISALAWFIAGVLKVLIELRVERKLDFKRIFGAGGMPSSHTATVVSLAIATGYFAGVESAVFAVSVILAIVVIHDAVGVRRETGKQAKILNAMMDTDVFNELDFEKKLKEYVGHSPLQVLVGGIVGVIVSVVFINILK